MYMEALVQNCDFDDTKVIYKYIPFKYIKKTLKTGKFIFNLISSWEDVYENFAFKECYRMNDGTLLTTSDDMQKRLYGQCWTDADESDAMWRIYSHFGRDYDNLAVRVSTTIGKMKDALKALNYDIRRVLYEDQFKIEQFPPLYVGDLEQFFRDSSFVKRVEFKHEQEIRIVIENEREKADLLSIHIPIDFFDEYMLDPRLSNKQEDKIRKSLVSRGALSEKIHKSDLYEFNVKTIQILN